MEWKEPPPRGGRNETMARPWVDELQTQPGKWALVDEVVIGEGLTTLGQAHGKARSRHKVWLDRHYPDQFEIKCRRRDMYIDVYARYIGGADG